MLPSVHLGLLNIYRSGFKSYLFFFPYNKKEESHKTMKLQRITRQNSKILTLVNGNTIQQGTDKQNKCRRFSLADKSLLKQQNTKNHHQSRFSISVQNPIPFSNTQGSFNKETRKINDCEMKKQPLRTAKKRNASQYFQNEKTLPPLIHKSPCIQQTNGSQFPDLQIQMLTDELFSQLKFKNIIFQSNSANFSIRRNCFLDIINFFIKISCTEEPSPIFNKYGQYSYIHDTVEKVNKTAKFNRKKQRMTKLTLQSKAASFQFNRQQFGREVKQYQQKNMTLKREAEALESQNQEAKKVITQIKVESDLKFAEHSRLAQQLYEVEQRIKTESLKLADLQNSLKEGQLKLAAYKQTEEQILNYVNNKAEGMYLMDLQKEHKMIEIDIFNLAAQLQSNMLASKLYYEPKPFKEIKEFLMKEMKEVNCVIRQSKSLSVEEKEIRMRDFVLKCMDHFEKKDVEMSNMNEFKTRMIRKYNDYIDKWQNNSVLKNDELDKLRTQFGVDSQKLKKTMTDLSETLSNCVACKFKIQPIMAKLSTVYATIEKNYKIGNSFY